MAKYNLIRMIKSRRMRWAANVTRMGKREMHAGILARRPKKKKEEETTMKTET
jgi:hypothetical protein